LVSAVTSMTTLAKISLPPWTPTRPSSPSTQEAEKVLMFTAPTAVLRIHLLLPETPSPPLVKPLANREVKPAPTWSGSRLNRSRETRSGRATSNSRWPPTQLNHQNSINTNSSTREPKTMRDNRPPLPPAMSRRSPS